MYTEFFGLSEKPFSLTPDPRYLFLSASHREALAHVLYGIEQGEGFIAVTGEVGTGKTTLCWTLLERLGPETEVAFVFNPILSGEELLRAICAELGLASDGLSRAQLGDQLNRFLVGQRRIGKRVLLIIDEAQNLPAQTLEEIRLLSNLETTTSKLLQILLFGQPELDAKLDSRELRQLRQRIGVRWSLQSLSPAETRDYVRHRLRMASGGSAEFFSDAALREVHRRSDGIPRLVNLICDRSLLAAYAAEAHRIGPELVAGAAREVLAPKYARKLAVLPAGDRTAVAVAALLGLAVAGVYAWERLGEAVAPRGATSPASAAPAAAASPEPQPQRAELEPAEELSALVGEPG
jgi:general secretion pathway protein A